ncbi:MAG: tryptophan--tRNA ligase [Proteobacteria bacterium]|nr:tryptophan--tRNA ligase [Pseudomonadota bacterium]MBU1739089.1 tryptophan--tRNA ligase [Pseudomonadota bacterium]
MRILSGIQPSGQLHIGNYFGMMLPMIENIDKGELYAFIVNLHALTSVQDRDRLIRDTYGAACDFLALGLDPERCIFWAQSDVPEVTELTWVLSTLTPMGLLERCHSYKDKVAKNIPATHGLFSYPVLMAADILLFQAEKIPVGKDQKQHVEVARDIALKFNNTFGETFVLPEPVIDDNMATVPGLDGQKMSKSYGNTIGIFLGEKELKKRVMAITTDATPVEDPKNPDTCNLFQIFKLFAPADRIEEVRSLYVNGGAMYGKIKLELVDHLWEYFREAREIRAKLENDHAYVNEVLAKGAAKAREKAMVTLDKVRSLVGLKYQS